MTSLEMKAMREWIRTEAMLRLAWQTPEHGWGVPFWLGGVVLAGLVEACWLCHKGFS